MNNTPKTIDFGYQNIPSSEKVDRVASVFHSVANKYDVMNDLMSLGMHRLWKYFAIELMHVKKGQAILDIAGGTGDLACAFAKKVEKEGCVVLADINASMLLQGRNRIIDEGYLSRIHTVQANAECLPFEENTFDAVSIAFGLRNVTDRSAALSSMYRVIKPGGCVMVLEFSHPVLPLLKKIYDEYSFRVIPALGEWVTSDRESYQYLVESIRRFPDQKNLLHLFNDAGFEGCDYHNLTGGIVACHRGYKF